MKVAFDTSVLVPAIVAGHRHHARVLVPPAERTYRTALARCAARRLASGVVFDALHLVTAEEAGADAMLTFNQADFVRLIDVNSPPITVPPDPPAVTL